MKSTGIVRKIDGLGRVVLPIELRRVLDVKQKDPIEIFVEGEHVIFKKYTPYRACAVTGEVTVNNKEYTGGIILSPLGAEILFGELQKKHQVNA
ncbi:AbrB/MazE/SpoVT family DNA-binding domain-containing protein [Priestia aryabhattai]